MSKRDEARRMLELAWPLVRQNDRGRKGSSGAAIGTVLDVLGDLLDEPTPSRALLERAWWLGWGAHEPPHTGGTTGERMRRDLDGLMGDGADPDGEWLEVARGLLEAHYGHKPLRLYGDGGLQMSEVVAVLAPLAHRDAEQRAEIERLTADRDNWQTAAKHWEDEAMDRGNEVERLESDRDRLSALEQSMVQNVRGLVARLDALEKAHAGHWHRGRDTFDPTSSRASIRYVDTSGPVEQADD